MVHDKTEAMLLKEWEKVERIPFTGWDFSEIKNQYSEENPPWNYRYIAKNLIKKSNSILDIGTGGGEIFSTLGPFPKNTVALEGYKPNVPIAKKRLTPLGVKVLYAIKSKFPLKDSTFDLVLNRHSWINVKEIARVIKQDGIFLTQQVDPKNLTDLRQIFGITAIKWPENAMENRIQQLKNNGFIIERTEEWTGKVQFKSINALVYFLKAIPWIVEDFSVKKYGSLLLTLNKKIQIVGPLKYTFRRYLIKACKDR